MNYIWGSLTFDKSVENSGWINSQWRLKAWTEDTIIVLVGLAPPDFSTIRTICAPCKPYRHFTGLSLNMPTLLNMEMQHLFFYKRHALLCFQIEPEDWLIINLNCACNLFLEALWRLSIFFWSIFTSDVYLLLWLILNTLGVWSDIATMHETNKSYLITDTLMEKMECCSL